MRPELGLSARKRDHGTTGWSPLDLRLLGVRDRGACRQAELKLFNDRGNHGLHLDDTAVTPLH